jgi:hypothetical protein
MKLNLERERDSRETNLSAALDDVVEAAVALRVPEQELVAQLLDCLHKKTSSKVVPLYPHKMYDPQAGP